MNNKFDKNIISFVLIIIAFVIVSFSYISLQSYREKKASEKVSEKVSSTIEMKKNQGSGNAIENPSEYEVIVDDETITFHGKDGSMIIYTFENDHLANVIGVYVAKNENAAEYLKKTFQMQVGDGVLKKVEREGSLVSVTYDMEYFKEYTKYTKEEIQNTIFENSSISE